MSSKDQILLTNTDENIKPYFDKIKRDFYKECHLEQFIFRIYIHQDCLLKKKCKFCKCNPLDKIREPISCYSTVAPDIMSKEKWELFKENHLIKIILQ